MKVFILAALVAAASAATSPLPTQTTNQNNCVDDANQNCWSRPDSDCFGIYESWSRVHCPLRCGFCGTPPCVDALDYCTQFEANTCTDASYAVWARQNCRKHCDLCHEITPPGGVTQTTVAAQPGETTVVPDIPSGGVTPPLPPTTSVDPISPYRVATGTVHTYMFVGEPSSTTEKCTYKGVEYDVGSRWNDGCQYECTCLSPVVNRITCLERCTIWATTDNVGNCQLKDEPGECCRRLECQ